jgi:hypothetical protein
MVTIFRIPDLKFGCWTLQAQYPFQGIINKNRFFVYVLSYVLLFTMFVFADIAYSFPVALFAGN